MTALFIAGNPNLVLSGGHFYHVMYIANDSSTVWASSRMHLDSAFCSCALGDDGDVLNSKRRGSSDPPAGQKDPRPVVVVLKNENGGRDLLWTAGD